MRRLGSVIAFAAGLTMVSPALVLAANQGTDAKAPARLEVTVDGPVLVTPSGMTLYVSTTDKPGESTCLNVVETTGFRGAGGGQGADAKMARKSWSDKTCVDFWPPYRPDAKAQPVGDFALIDRPEGGKQWAFQGHPLYLSVKDKSPGDRWGATFQWTNPNAQATGGRAAQAQQRGRGGFRFATVQPDFPPGLQITRFGEDMVVANGNGRPVYTPHGVRVSKACAGCDEELVQPIVAGAMAKVGGDWSIVQASAGEQQYAFRGKPLYSMRDGVHATDVAEAGGWELVVFQKGAGKPHEIETHLTLLGDVYTNSAGHTLYTFNCGGGIGLGGGTPCDNPGAPAGYWVALCGTGKDCANRWHPYLAPANAKPTGEWSVVDVAYPMFTDPHGTTYPSDAPRVKAWAYRGRPVYTYFGDEEAGDIWGHNIKWPLGASSFTAVQVPGHAENQLGG